MRKLLICLFTLSISIQIYSQQSKGMSYQAVVRDGKNELIVEGSVGIKIDIKIENMVVYSETHTELTNENGLLTIEIGSGTVLDGSFADIDWSAPQHFLMVSIDPEGGSNYTIEAESKLNAVPYAFDVEILDKGEDVGQMNFWNGDKWIPLQKGEPGQVLIVSSEGIPTWSGDTYPIVTTERITNITPVSARVQSNVVSAGGRNIIARGLVYGLTPKPNFSDNVITTSNGLGNYELELTSLMADSTYYVRAYASNSLGTGFGNELEFTTSQATAPNVITTDATNITQLTAVVGGTVSDNGGSTVTERGILWGEEENIDPNTAKKEILGSGTGSYSIKIENLVAEKTYYYLAYATNEIGTSYGVEKSFTTMEPTVPILSTKDVINITNINASSGGIIELDGGSPIKSKGVVWSTSPNPTFDNDKTNDGEGAEEFTSILTALDPSTTYYVRAYAENDNGFGYGQEKSFTTRTEAGTLPIVETNYATDISAAYATLNGTLIDGGGSDLTKIGFVLSEKENPSLSDGDFRAAQTSDLFSAIYDELKNNTTYYFRAFAVNSYGIAYGSILSFTTQTDVPPTIKLDYSFISSRGITGSIRLIDDGNSPIEEVGLLLKHAENDNSLYFRADSINNIENGFEIDISNIENGGEYYIRAYARNSYGTSFSLEQDTIFFEKIEKVTDIDNNSYHVVKIGNQYWLQENLKVTRFNNGLLVEYLVSKDDWVMANDSIIAGWCYYDNDPELGRTFGNIYNMHTVRKSSPNICPTGWKVPNKEEWLEMINHLGGIYLAGDKIRSKGVSGNSFSGFNGKLGGFRDAIGSFLWLNRFEDWWSYTEREINADRFRLSIDNSFINYSVYAQNYGHYIRCIKD